MKKLLNLFLVFVTAFSMFVNVNAKMTGPFTITINNSKSGHTYEVYQIFAGDVSIAGTTTENPLASDKILSNITWGTGVTEAFKTAHGDAATYAETLLARNAEEVAKEIEAGLGTVTGSTNTMSEGKYTISNLPAGYYLIKDQDNSLVDVNGNPLVNDAATEFIIRLVDSIQVTPKSYIPTADKKIVEGNDKLEVSSKYAVGDTVSYELIGTLPSNYDYYETYKYIFHDTLSNGLTLNYDSIKVYVDGTEITTGWTKTRNGNNFDVTFDDTKTVTYTVTENETEVTKNITADSVITVKYTATVNNGAVRGLPGNENTLVIEFSNNPGTNETGKTTPEEVKVYVFNLKFNKIASDLLNKEDLEDRLLAGAQFMLERKVNGNWVKVSGIDTDGTTLICSNDENVDCIKYVVDTNNATFHFNGLSEGEYRLTETVTPDKYNTITPVVFTLVATYDETDPEDATVLTGISVTSTATNEVAQFTVEEEDPQNPTLSTVFTTITNIKGIELPLTGGIGTAIFTVIGVSLMGFAVVSFIKSKKEEM